jgi:hypothetical protein
MYNFSEIRNKLPIHNVGYTTPNTSFNCGCGCEGEGSCGDQPNNYSVVRNSSRRRIMNGVLEDYLTNIAGGQPLAVVEFGLTNDSILKLGLLGVGLIALNKYMK